MSRSAFHMPEKLSLEGLQSEIGSLIERWWHCGLSTGPLDGQDLAPPVELRDEPECYRVMVELPGVKQSAIDLTAQATSLVICGEKQAPPIPEPPPEAETPKARVLQTERRYGSFKRTVTLPGPVQVDATSAVFTDGVLEVSLPKVKGSGPADVRIDVQKG